MLFHNSIEIPLDKFCWVENTQEENEFKSLHVEADNFAYHVYWEKQTNKTPCFQSFLYFKCTRNFLILFKIHFKNKGSQSDAALSTREDIISSVIQFLKSEDNNNMIQSNLHCNVDDKTSAHNSFITYMTSVFFMMRHLCLQCTDPRKDTYKCIAGLKSDLWVSFKVQSSTGKLGVTNFPLHIIAIFSHEQKQSVVDSQF